MWKSQLLGSQNETLFEGNFFQKSNYVKMMQVWRQPVYTIRPCFKNRGLIERGKSYQVCSWTKSHRLISSNCSHLLLTVLEAEELVIRVWSWAANSDRIFLAWRLIQSLHGWERVLCSHHLCFCIYLHMHIYKFVCMCMCLYGCRFPYMCAHACACVVDWR